MLKAQRVDIVLSDWNMPVMSGLDLLQAMRNDASLESIPFIMITAEAERSRSRKPSPAVCRPCCSSRTRPIGWQLTLKKHF